MQAVILAAGLGSRLGKLSNGLPKCLVNIGGRPLIQHQLEALADNGVGPVLVVVGYRAEAIREVVGSRADYIVNHQYEHTNSLYSLWLAREWIKGPFVLLNCDLFFHPDILIRLLEKEGNALAYDSTASNGREQTKVAIRKHRVVDLGKDLPAGSARGESLGILQFDAEGARVLLDQTDALIKSGNEKVWVTEAVRTCCSLVAVNGVNVAGLPWAELDYPHDLEEARKEVWPAIWKARWKKLVLWKRTRRFALSLGAVGLACTGWYASSVVGPASIEWATISPRGAEKIVLATPGGSKKWWVIGRGQPLTAEVEGGKMLIVDFRSLQSSPGQIPTECVYEASIDDKPYHWDIVAGTPDPTVTLPGFTVGERTRLRLGLPPGSHGLKVNSIGGTCDRLLVRIRQPE
jgi:L-glutamine-phosphate cytidylyltransferase